MKNFSPSAIERLIDVTKLVKASSSEWNALHLASDTLIAEGVSESEEKKLTEDLLKTFEEWKLNEGVYPPQHLKKKGGITILQRRRGGIRGICPYPVEKYAPWECCDFVKTPVGLFWLLFTENYRPLDTLIRTNGGNPSKALALLILLSWKPKNPVSSEDCVTSALLLAAHRIDNQKTLITRMSPAAKKEHDRKEMARLRARAKGEQTKSLVLAIYDEIKQDGRTKSINKEIAARIHESGRKISEAQVSRVLSKVGLSQRKIRKSLHH